MWRGNAIISREDKVARLTTFRAMPSLSAIELLQSTAPMTATRLTSRSSSASKRTPKPRQGLWTLHA